MTTAAPAQFKITYTTANVDMDLFHRLFDEALAKVRSEAGRTHPLYIDWKPVATAGEPLVDTSPIDTSVVLGKFAAATPENIDSAVRSAKKAQKLWEKLGYQGRVKLMRRAAELIRERKFELAAVMSL
ncbi:MAG: aldehyde dehydrogenase family protein, partial [Elusimicrobiota bacterium]